MRFLTIATLLLLSTTAQSSERILVAIIDTGVDAKHPKLQGSLWVNKGESGLDKNGQDKSTNGIDDDRNGFVDDLNGYNFVDNNGKLSDRHGHGTHIAGIIHKEAQKAELMILKYYDPYSPVQNLANTSRAIKYAIQMGAKIINYSGGGRSPDLEERAALLEAEKKGILLIAAAGNDGRNNDFTGFYPASYNFSNIIAVASLSQESSLLESSNYGHKVHIAALGEAIISTLPGGKEGPMTGTSQATAVVTGLAALIAENEPDAAEIKERVIKYGQMEKTLRGKVASSRALNFERSLASRGKNKDAFDNASLRSENIFDNQSVWSSY